MFKGNAIVEGHIGSGRGDDECRIIFIAEHSGSEEVNGDVVVVANTGSKKKSHPDRKKRKKEQSKSTGLLDSWEILKYT